MRSNELEREISISLDVLGHVEEQNEKYIKGLVKDGRVFAPFTPTKDIDNLRKKIRSLMSEYLRETQ